MDEIAYIGDDIIDIGVLMMVGFAICPQDAVPEVKKMAHWIVPVNGGKGVIRFILKTKGLWKDAL